MALLEYWARREQTPMNWSERLWTWAAAFEGDESFLLILASVFASYSLFTFYFLQFEFIY